MPTSPSYSTEDVIELAQQLICVPSTANNLAALREAVALLANIVASCPDVTIESFDHGGKPSFLAYRGKVRPSSFDILLNAHVDVVPAVTEMFRPRIEDGKLYGRGALDMKGTAAALTAVFCEMVSTVPYHLGLQIVSDEEIGGYDGAKVHIQDGVRAAFVIVGEYSNHRHTIYNAARGICWVELKFNGKTAHGGHLWHGTNAVVKASEFAGAVLRTYPTPEKETWTTTASIASIETPNKTYNKVPDTAILKIDFRFTREDLVFQNRQSLEAFVASLDPDATIVDIASFGPAIEVERLNPYVQGLAQAMKHITAQEPAFLSRPGASDGRHFAQVGSDTVEFGLYGKYSHADGEYVELASFYEYCQIMRAFLLNPIPAGSTPASAPADQPLSMELLGRLTAMRTLTHDLPANDRAITFIQEFLEERGMHTQRFEQHGYHSLLATTQPGCTAPTVLLSGHIDIVPTELDDYQLSVDGDKLRGRGVADMKFAIAGYLELVDTLQDQLHELDFGICITSDEEIGGRNGTGALVKKLGLAPNVVIVPDGGENWKIETFSKGVQWIKLRANGKSAHASRPWEGKNAISPLLAAIRDIEAMIPASSNRRATTLSVGTIAGGSSGNQVPAAAGAMLDIRYGSQAEFEQLFPKIKTVAARHNVEAISVADGPPTTNDPKDPYIRRFRELIIAAGKKPGTSYSYGATDGRYFSALGIPTIIVSPESGGRHTKNEWLSLSGFETFRKILHQYVTQVAGTGAPTALARPRRNSSPRRSRLPLS
jgi:succinyl-diaminopimelate desuccinylase